MQDLPFAGASVAMNLITDSHSHSILNSNDLVKTQTHLACNCIFLHIDIITNSKILDKFLSKISKKNDVFTGCFRCRGLSEFLTKGIASLQRDSGAPANRRK